MAIAVAAFVVACSFVTIALTVLVIRRESRPVSLDEAVSVSLVPEVEDARSWPEPRHMAIPGKRPALRTRSSR